jgi:hypothetical protein
LLAVAVSLIAANWFLFVTGVVLFCLFIIRTRTEEENLVARFGDSYRAYMERTGRFLPRIRANRRGGDFVGKPNFLHSPPRGQSLEPHLERIGLRVSFDGGFQVLRGM